MLVMAALLLLLRRYADPARNPLVPSRGNTRALQIDYVDLDAHPCFVYHRSRLLQHVGRVRKERKFLLWNVHGLMNGAGHGHRHLSRSSGCLLHPQTVSKGAVDENRISPGAVLDMRESDKPGAAKDNAIG